MQLALNQGSTHVVQQAIKVLPPQPWMLEEISPVFRTVSCHQTGIQVTKCLGLKVDLSDYILPKALELAQDPFGNYAVQQYI